MTLYFHNCLKGATSWLAHMKSLNEISQIRRLQSVFILVPLRFINMCSVIFYPTELLFSGFLQFKGNFVRGKN